MSMPLRTAPAAVSAEMSSCSESGEIERHGRRQHLDMAEFLGRRVQEHVAILGRAARAERLEHVLHGDADLALDAADRLLQRFGEDRVGTFDAHRKLQLSIGIEHRFQPFG